jgi:transposase
VNALGVDEHVWSHTGPPGSGMATGIVDHTRDAHGMVHARLLDLVPGRSGKAYADWLKERGAGFTAGIKTAARDPFRGYANAIRDELPEAITVLDAFHVVKLGSAMVDEVRRRVQQDTLGHRGRKGDPLYGIRRTLQIGAEHLTDKQAARLDAKLAAGDPDHEITLAWQCYQKLRAIYHARPEGAGNSSTKSSHHSQPARSRSRPPRPDPQTMKDRDPRLLRHQRRLQWAHRSHQRRHRNHPPNRPRLP